MAHAYTPGLKVSRRMTHLVKRMLPIPGETLVKVGEHVKAEQIVAQTFMPGDVFPVNLANVLAMPPGDVPGCLLVKEGDAIEVGQAIARSKGIFGFFQTEYKAKAAGTLESVSKVTGQIIIRGAPHGVRVKAFLTGQVAEVFPQSGVAIEAETTFIQGIFGIGGEAYGPIRMACKSAKQELTADLITPEHAGAVVIGGARMTGDAVRKAIEVKAVAIISGGMDDQDLKDILGYDLGVAVTGSERVGITLVITEGFGEIAMAERTFALLSSLEGQRAAVNGATQIRAGVMRPEIVIPLGDADKSAAVESAIFEGVLEKGTPVRIIRDPWFGLLGKVDKLPPEPQTLASGSKARVLTVQLDSGETVTVPRANVEILGD